MCVLGPELTFSCVTGVIMSGDYENMKKQTLSWMENYPRNKLKMKSMVLVIIDGIPRFVPKHLL